jgi:hypothetical protein
MIPTGDASMMILSARSVGPNHPLSNSLTTLVIPLKSKRQKAL